MNEQEIVKAVTAKLAGEFRIGARVSLPGHGFGTISGKSSHPRHWFVDWDNSVHGSGPWNERTLGLL